ncbi:Splicing factor 3B subunit 1 [Camellia lanceoleosa]|uniref:Splicing factor 3B subunit 1 n=1 Tax=Camellia lanceoleosa TaxID=1840588 RepID=A0ACC0FWV4_9ERIC|nr:Splicing factor 3B subunit 1 [Camellia lanceoleosa]
MPRGVDEDESMEFKKPSRIIDREDEYRRRRLNRAISPERHDAFASGDKTPDVSVRTDADVMREEALKREKEDPLRLIAKKKKEEEERKASGGGEEKEREPAANAAS